MDFPSESVDLIYIDPPFFTNENYQVIWGDEQEKRMFNDVWKIGIATYRSFMKKRIKQIWRVLKPTGSFYLHCDNHANAHLRVICDTIFGKNKYRSTIYWKRYPSVSYSKDNFSNIVDTILFYTKGDEYTFNKIYDATDEAMKRKFSSIEPKTLRKFKTFPLIKSGKSNHTLFFGDKKVVVPDNQRFVWSQDRVNSELKKNPHCIYWTNTGKPMGKSYLDEYAGRQIYSNLWNDINAVKHNSGESLGYPTQKPEALLERIIVASSNRNDIVADFFCGCGTTLAVAKDLERRFIGIDFSHTACTLMAERIDYPIAEIIGMPMTVEETKKMKPFEFQNWACRRFGGMSNPKKVADGGIDGWKSGIPIEVKQHSVGSPAVKKFITAIQQDSDNNKGYMIAYEFTKGAKEDRAWAMEKLDIDIQFVKVDTLLKG